MGKKGLANQQELFKLNVLNDLRSDYSFFKDCMNTVPNDDIYESTQLFACSNLKLYFEISKLKEQEGYQLVFVDGEAVNLANVFLDISKTDELKTFVKISETIARYRNDIELKQTVEEARLNTIGIPCWATIHFEFFGLSGVFKDNRIDNDEINNATKRFNSRVWDNGKTVFEKHFVSLKDFDEINKLRIPKKKKEQFKKAFELAHRETENVSTFNSILGYLRYEGAI